MRVDLGTLAGAVSGGVVGGVGGGKRTMSSDSDSSRDGVGGVNIGVKPETEETLLRFGRGGDGRSQRSNWVSASI